MGSFGDNVRKIEFGEPHTHTTYNRPVEDLIVALDERLGEVDDGATMNRDDAVVDILLDGKVDKVAGKGLSANDYTDSDKDKVDSIVEHFRGTFGTQAELDSIPTPVSGNYADVRVGGELKRYIYNATSDTWILPEAGGTGVDAAGVKQLYESNPDTNAFGDADKSKLGGIDTGATKNATDAQLRARGSHTGTQNVSTITGLSDAATTPIATIRSGITKGDVGLGNLENFPITGSVSDPSDEKLATAGAVKKAYDRVPAFSEVTSTPETATRWPAFSEVTSTPETATRWPTYGEVSEKPATFPPSTHSHEYLPLTGGIVTDDIFVDGAKVLHTGDVMQSGGESTTNLMSQAAIMEAINDVMQNIGGGSAPRPTKDHGEVAVAGSQTVTCNVQESDFHIMSLATANATGTLTIDFTNMPDTLGKHFSWHVRLQRGARKTVAFVQTINWAGGVAPTFTTASSGQDLILFYKVDSETIRGMVIDAW